MYCFSISFSSYACFNFLISCCSDQSNDTTVVKKNAKNSRLEFFLKSHIYILLMFIRLLHGGSIIIAVLFRLVNSRALICYLLVCVALQLSENAWKEKKKNKEKKREREPIKLTDIMDLLPLSRTFFHRINILHLFLSLMRLLFKANPI